MDTGNLTCYLPLLAAQLGYGFLIAPCRQAIKPLRASSDSLCAPLSILRTQGCQVLDSTHLRSFLRTALSAMASSCKVPLASLRGPIHQPSL
ncbi:hypothetical protein NDU88_005431 [Pleurodeles waltl]|uniref:Uncharacterized protein n=1 Tax=Pleurodeles waltl TaxID=8319 RepID=A0AAV7VM12_PLEWA|nr:hypothetical protein NDU88_005431 [Pleurodeles waltl]